MGSCVSALVPPPVTISQGKTRACHARANPNGSPPAPRTTWLAVVLRADYLIRADHDSMTTTASLPLACPMPRALRRHDDRWKGVKTVQLVVGNRTIPCQPSKRSSERVLFFFFRAGRAGFNHPRLHKVRAMRSFAKPLGVDGLSSPGPPLPFKGSCDLTIAGSCSSSC